VKKVKKRNCPSLSFHLKTTFLIVLRSTSFESKIGSLFRSFFFFFFGAKILPLTEQSDFS